MSDEHARVAVQIAITLLEQTRWMPEGPLPEWRETREGKNCEYVNKAIATLRQYIKEVTP